jgi:hypothetical protein
MWKLYTGGKDGVAIQTTVGRLKTCLSHEPRKVFIAEVDYLDHEAPPKNASDSPNILVPLTTKRRSFKHESEVRVIIERMQGRTQEEFLALLDSEFGEAISIDLSTLIERIVVSPDYPAWGIETLQNLVPATGLAVNVELSDLLRIPESDDLCDPDRRSPEFSGQSLVARRDCYSRKNSVR